MTLAQNSSRRLLSISSKSFIITIICHSCLASLFFLYIYEAMYFIRVPFLLQNFLRFVKINSLLSSIWKTFISILLLFSIFRSQIQKTSINLSFKYKYIIYVFRVFMSSIMAAHVFIKSEGELYGPNKLTCTSSNFSFTLVIGLLWFITWFYLLAMYSIYIILKSFLMV